MHSTSPTRSVVSPADMGKLSPTFSPTFSPGRDLSLYSRWNNTHVCSMGLVIRPGASVPPEANNIAIGAKRKRGRQGEVRAVTPCAAEQYSPASVCLVTN
jgi:hypothetical protein